MRQLVVLLSGFFAEKFLDACDEFLFDKDGCGSGKGAVLLDGKAEGGSGHHAELTGIRVTPL